jgi:hypothetical protein
MGCSIADSLVLWGTGKGMINLKNTVNKLDLFDMCVCAYTSLTEFHPKNDRINIFRILLILQLVKIYYMITKLGKKLIKFLERVN